MNQSLLMAGLNQYENGQASMRVRNFIRYLRGGLRPYSILVRDEVGPGSLYPRKKSDANGEIW